MRAYVRMDGRTDGRMDGRTDGRPACIYADGKKTALPVRSIRHGQSWVPFCRRVGWYCVARARALVCVFQCTRALRVVFLRLQFCARDLRFMLLQCCATPLFYFSSLFGRPYISYITVASCSTVGRVRPATPRVRTTRTREDCGVPPVRVDKYSRKRRRSEKKRQYCLIKNSKRIFVRPEVFLF